MKKAYFNGMEKGVEDFDGDVDQYLEYLIYKGAERVKLGYFRDFTIFLN